MESLTAPFFPEILLSAARLIEKLRLAFPGAILIQNSGLGRLYELTARLVDAFCWENPSIALAAEQESALAGRLAKLRRNYGIRTLVLLESKDPLLKEEDLFQYLPALHFALKHGFLFYVSPLNYASGVTTALLQANHLYINNSFNAGNCL